MDDATATRLPLTVGSVTTDADALERGLRDPFPAGDVEWRVQSSGKTPRGPWVRVLAYITNRAIMERLDSVCGVDGWRNEFSHAPSGAVLCGLSIRINGEWVTKWDGANETDIEAAKGGLSNAMKRAGVQWGIGRYLYNLEEGYAVIASADDRDAHYLAAKPDKHGDALKWNPPKLPAWALPGGSGRPGAVSAPVRARGDAAKATLAAAEAAVGVTGDVGDVRLPGTKAHFNGHGGKTVAEVPRDALPDVLAKLKLAGEDKYAAVIAAVKTAIGPAHSHAA